MNLRSGALLMLIGWLAVPVLAGEGGAEMLVHGEVVKVVPIASDRGVVACHPPRPDAGADLITLLEWDLRVHCVDRAHADRKAAYRVYYRWDGRTYSQVMAHPPGPTVTLRVRLQ